VFVGVTQIISRLNVNIIYISRRTTITYFGNMTTQPERNLCLTLILLTSTIVAPPSNASKWQIGFNSAFKGLICRKLMLLVPQLETLFPSMLNKTIKNFVFIIFKEIRYQVLTVNIKCINKCHTIGTVRYQ
jgi:hypothetical protein